MLKKQLSIIIVNYKTPELLLKCIDSIRHNTKTVNYEIIVVDNCSNDNSEELITQAHNDVIWINNPRNDGFGRANNTGLLKSNGEYVLLVNSDIVVPENTIEKCLKYIKEHPDVGVLGCKLLNEDGSLQNSTYYYTSEYSEILRENLLFDYLITFKDSSMKALMGAFLLFPRKVIEQEKGFDPDFFMYCEELDLCNRIISHGYQIKYLDEVFVYHKEGGSSSDRTWVIKQKFLSKALLVYKERGILKYILYHLLFTLNTITNFFLMWLLDNVYRKEFRIRQMCYYSNYFHFLSIPFLYSRHYGSEKRMLRKD